MSRTPLKLSVAATSLALVAATAPAATATGDSQSAIAYDRPAASSQPAHAFTAPAVPSTGTIGTAAATGPVAIRSFYTYHGIITTNGTYGTRANVQVDGTSDVNWDTVAVTTKVTINGTARGTASVYPDGVELRGTLGTGRTVLGPSTITGKLNNGSTFTSLDNTKSNVFNLRRDTWGWFKIRRSGSKVRFTARGLIRNGYTGRAATAKYAWVQYSSGGHWKNLKKIRLNATGHGSYTITKKGKRTYRLYVSKTATVQGMIIKINHRL